MTIFSRHIATFLLFYIGVIVFYLLCAENFRSKWWGLLGAILLVLHPRIFAESFYNSKDIGFLSAFVISFYFGMRFVQKPTGFRAFLFAVASGFAIDMRIIGGLVHVLILPQLLFVTHKRLKSIIKPILIYIVSSVGFVYAFWPILWENPIVQFWNAITYMGGYSQLGGGVLYFGEFIQAPDVPWHYLPVWIGITTPVVYLALFMAGLVCVLVKRDRWGLTLFCWFIIPILFALLTSLPLYDGWRHFYFIYPAFVGLAISGLVHLWRKCAATRIAGIVLFVLVVVSVSLFMIRNHPYQNVYFSELIGGIAGANNRFDLDYWGLSFKRGLQYVAKRDSDRQIPVFVAYGFEKQILFLPKEYRRFVWLSDTKGARYILSNFRWQSNVPPYPEIYHITVDGVKIMSVFQVPPESLPAMRLDVSQ